MSKTEKLTINQKLAKLDQSIEWFYGDQFELDQALAKYQAAIEQAADIENDLKELENQVKVIEDFTKS